MRRCWLAQAADDRGTSLAETLVVTAIIGLIAVMLAPVESFLLKRLREAHALQASSLDVAWSAALLSDDIRGAQGVIIDGSRGLTVVTPRGIEVVWRLDGSGLHRVVRSGEAPLGTTRRFSSVTDLRVTRPRVNLVTVTLGDSGARRHTVEFCLRNARVSP